MGCCATSNTVSKKMKDGLDIKPGVEALKNGDVKVPVEVDGLVKGFEPNGAMDAAGKMIGTELN